MPDQMSISLSRLERDPNRLLRLLVLVALISMVLILSLTVVGIHRSSVADVLRIAEDDAVRIGTVMVEQQYRYLFGGGEQSISIKPEDMRMFDSHVRGFLHPFAIVKIKVFAIDGTIVYSTDKKIIGKSVVDNPRLERALNGEVDSHQETKEQVVDLAEEQLLDVDVVVTYLPVRNLGGEVAGSFELYLDVTRYRAEITKRVTTSAAILAVILLVVFALSFIVVRMGAKQLKSLLFRLRKLAVTDPLTGVYNRGALLSRAEEELSRLERRKAQPSGNSLGVVMIDLDFFKKVNDTHGHQAGDDVLREMSQRVTNCLRDYDIFGRYGGEEFLIIIPDADFKGAMVVAERARHELVKAPFALGDLKLPITASFGVTSCNDPSEGLDGALQRADEALYLAKEMGRDRVVGKEEDPQATAVA